jgi:predicted O-linked N-acetylglucosamine transferase (SPINDLY family)
LEQRGLGSVADTLDSRAADSGDVAAMHDLARRAMSRGQSALAIEQLERATALKPLEASLRCSLGAAYRHEGRFEEARHTYEQALALKANYPEVLSNLGEWCIAKGQNVEALSWFDRALVCNPEFFEAKLNKTAALFELARYEEARGLAEQLVADEPHRAEAYLNLGNVLLHTGKAKQGIKHYRKALELQPGYAEAHFNLASLLGSKDDLANTIGYLERRIKERGDSVQNLGMLATAHQAAGHLSEAEELCHRILQRQPDSITALVTLGGCLSSGGDAAAAVPLYERIMELDATQSAMGSNVLFEYNNLSASGRDVVFDRHRKWATQFEAPLLTPDAFTERDCDPHRKLRIGYVSGDFSRHPVGFLLRDILRHHDESKFSIHCFSMLIRPEEALSELREAADAWEDIFYLDDDEVVDLIRKAEIDILVDLSGHTAFNRLLVFARRPAPVQAEWIGYFHSTGMTSIDYFITDPTTTPPGSGQMFSETPVFLPHTRFCYGPPDYAPEVVASPFEKLGVITFGSFNRLPKITEEVIAAWSKILHAVPQSRLLVKSSAFTDTTAQERLLARFERHGIGPERLDLREGSPHAAMLSDYGDVDIVLDTFPFNGGMTTLEALWMGVPVVTIAGNTVVSRQTISALANIGLADELAFPDVEAYVKGAVALANNPARLAELRSQMRPRMAASPLRQPEQFTRDLEALYRRMWQAWCRGEKLTG